MPREKRDGPPLDKFIGINVTKEQFDTYHNWPGSREEHAEYLRQCIDSRYKGDIEELRRRRDMFRKKAAELNTEAAELDEIIKAEEEREDSVSFEIVAEEFREANRYEIDHEGNVAWLRARYGWSQSRACEFLAWLNAERIAPEGVEDD